MQYRASSFRYFFLLIFWAKFVLITSSCQEDESRFGGTQTFIKLYGGGGTDLVTDLLETNDGRYALIGGSTSFNSDTTRLDGNDSDALFILTDRSGNVISQRAYGNASKHEVARSFVETAGGGFLIAGTAYSNPIGLTENQLQPSRLQIRESQIFLLEVDANGEQIGETIYLGANQGDYFEATRLQRTLDGGFILSASRLQNRENPLNNGLQVVLLKLTNNLNVQWSRAFGIDEQIANFSGAVVQNQQGEYFVTGALERARNGPLEPRFIKTDIIGNEVFDFRFGDQVANASVAAQTAYTSDIEQDGFGYILAGAKGNPGNRDILLIKVGESANAEWIKNYGGPGDQVATKVFVTENGDYLVAGASYSGNSANMLLMKASANDTSNGLSFEPIWIREFGFDGLDVGRAVLQTRDGSVLLAGSAQFGTITMGCLIKTDREGRVSDGL